MLRRLAIVLIVLARIKLVQEVASFLSQFSCFLASAHKILNETLALLILLNQTADIGLNFGLHELPAVDLLLKHFNLRVLLDQRVLFRQ